jgi:tRNA(fMet)-specific endonuclease VapC
MSPRYILDTNTVSYVIKGNIPAVRERLLKIPISQVSISVITEAELRFGVARRPEATRLKIAIEEFLIRISVLPWDSEVAQVYAQVRAALERVGQPLGNFDLMIAAQALATQSILVTNDRVFRQVKHLKTEDWTKRP